jgi:hypothetical protein
MIGAATSKEPGARHGKVRGGLTVTLLPAGISYPYPTHRCLLEGVRAAVLCELTRYTPLWPETLCPYNPLLALRQQPRSS